MRCCRIKYNIPAAARLPPTPDPPKHLSLSLSSSSAAYFIAVAFECFAVSGCFQLLQQADAAIWAKSIGIFSHININWLRREIRKTFGKTHAFCSLPSPVAVALLCLGSFHKYGQHVAQLNCQLEAVAESQVRESERGSEGGALKYSLLGNRRKLICIRGPRMYMSIYAYIYRSGRSCMPSKVIKHLKAP